MTLPNPTRRAPAWRIYDLLIERALASPAADAPVAEVLIGLTWTLCRIDGAPPGLAMSPGTPTRTLPWPGTLAGRPARELVAWLGSWDPYEATLAMAAVNALIGADSTLAADAAPLPRDGPANLSVFRHFAPALAGKRVAVIGRYPGLDGLDLGWDLRVLERQPGPGDLPDPAAEYELPEADWVFLTATSIPNKTFPRLAQLAAGARLVLMGPTVPWLPELADFGVDHLAGVQVEDAAALRRTIAEGGGTRIFDSAVRYAVLPLPSLPEHQTAP